LLREGTPEIPSTKPPPPARSDAVASDAMFHFLTPQIISAIQHSQQKHIDNRTATTFVQIESIHCCNAENSLASGKDQQRAASRTPAPEIGPVLLLPTTRCPRPDWITLGSTALGCVARTSLESVGTLPPRISCLLLYCNLSFSLSSILSSLSLSSLYIILTPTWTFTYISCFPLHTRFGHFGRFYWVSP
jgi:hypothetical protein